MSKRITKTQTVKLSADQLAQLSKLIHSSRPNIGFDKIECRQSSSKDKLLVKFNLEKIEEDVRRERYGVAKIEYDTIVDYEERRTVKYVLGVEKPPNIYGIEAVWGELDK